MSATPALLLIAGLEGSPAVWGPTEAALQRAAAAQGRAPLSVQRAAPRPGPSLAAQAEATERPPGPLFIVGASYGGLLGWALSAKPENNVVGMILIETLPSAAAYPPRRAAEARAARLAPPALLGALWRRRLHAELRRDHADPTLRRAILREALPPVALMERLDALHRWGLPAAPGCPCLWVLARGRSGAWPAAALPAAQPAARLRWLPGAARPHLCDPSGLAALVLQALDAVSAGRFPLVEPRPSG